ncbi:hypothetical protein ACFY1P_20145 [Streptomyces sp. NPDC001407]|uniref:hypothetical protein n=1 Tax=Streptomyces sp. NPDC001407 TaxID=3364573 RepID=UPI0036893D2C
MRSVLKVRRARVALWCAGGLLVIGVSVGMGAAVRWLWNGPPYPAADPDRVAARLKAEAGRVHDEAALPGALEAPARVETGACDYRGLRSIAHIDQGRSDVRDFRLSWQVTDVPEGAARSAQERTRRRLVRDGWRLISENVSDRGFRFERPGSGERVDVDWYRPTGTYAVTAYAPCGRVPDGFDEYQWPAARWAPA